MISVAMNLPGGQQAATMRVAEAYVRSFGEAWAPQTQHGSCHHTPLPPF
jgi:hypothetical protein